MPSDFSDKITVIPQEFGDDYPEIKGYMYKIKPKVAIDESIFTPREINILNWLCDVYHDATATQMSEITHLHNSPWDTTVKNKGLYQSIDYLLCIDDESPLTREEAVIKFSEHSEMLKNFGLMQVN